MLQNLTNVNSQMQELANKAITAAKDKFGISLDFSENSLQQLEVLLQQAHEGYKQTSSSGNTLNIPIENTVRVWGSYFGEVIRRQLGGDWIVDQKNVFLELDSRKVDPLGQVRLLIVGESVYNIQSYFQELKTGIPIKLAGQSIDHETDMKKSSQNTRSHRSSIILTSVCGILGFCILSVVGFWVLNRQGILSIPSQINVPSFISIPTNVPTPTITVIPLSKQYSQEASPAIQNLVQWQSSFASFSDSFFRLSDGSVFIIYNYKVQEYYSMLSLSGDNVSADYFYPHYDMKQVQELITPANSVSINGQKIINVLGPITPPEEITVAHNQVVACINTRMAFSGLVANTLTNVQQMDLTQFNTSNSNYSCSSFDAAVAKLVTYVNANK